MSNFVQRPFFGEGQLLGAVDLNDSVDHARGQIARHGRALHTWGIAEGLDLVTLPAPVGVQVSVASGIAIDGSGRELVVSDPLPLDEADLPGVLVQDPGTTPSPKPVWYPVFLSGCDRGATQLLAALTTCGTGGTPGRIDETCVVSVGRPGDETSFEQAEPAAGLGPDGAIGSSPWLMLIGYVQGQRSSDGSYQFTDAARSPAGLTAPRFVGIKADRVEAQSPTLTLSATPADPQAPKPVLVLDASPADGPVFTYGLATGDSVQPLFAVDSHGDAVLAGSLSSGVDVDIQIASGIATDGMLLPLPGTIRQQDVDDGAVALHVQITPLLPGPPEPPPPVQVAQIELYLTVTTPGAYRPPTPQFDSDMLLLALGGMFTSSDVTTAQSAVHAQGGSVTGSDGSTSWSEQNGWNFNFDFFKPWEASPLCVLLVAKDVQGLAGAANVASAMPDFTRRFPPLGNKFVVTGNFGLVSRTASIGTGIDPAHPGIETEISDTPLQGSQGPDVTSHVNPYPVKIPQYPSANARWLFATPIQCSVDVTTRQVSVRFRWLGTDGGGPVTTDVPGACRYLVIAQKAAKAIKPPLPLSVRKVCS
jgi:hypothetical protein